MARQPPNTPYECERHDILWGSERGHRAFAFVLSSADVFHFMVHVLVVSLEYPDPKSVQGFGVILRLANLQKYNMKLC